MDPSKWDSLELMKFNKRFGGLAIEKFALNMVARASKMYAIWGRGGCKESSKAKGVGQKFKHERCLEVLEKETVVKGENTNLVKRGAEINKVKVLKRALTAIYTKYRVFDDNSFCYPLFVHLAGPIVEVGDAFDLRRFE
jgi:hypothetical protein